MSQSVSEYVVARMHAWGVRRVFGYPGDGINGVLGALHRAQDRIRFVQVRHEEMAAFMACGHAKFTGEVGTCLATSGPGAIHLLAGLYDAKADRQPVVAIVGQQSRSAIGGQYQQEVDLLSLFKDVAHEFVHMATTPTQVRSLIDGAYRTALAERTPTCVILPTDVQSLPYREPPHEHGTVHSGLGYFAPSVVPHPSAIAILIGVGAADAAAEVLETAEVLGAGIAKALLGKPVVPDVLPHVTGGIGLLGTTATHRMITDCDTLLMIGSRFPYAEFLPEEGSVRGVQIDIEGRNLGLRYPMEVNLTGDAARPAAPAAPQARPRLAQGDRAQRREVAGDARAARHERRDAAQSAARLP
jgi:pyruvate dehydrogenase (quinone)